jgi:hypothetical protein
LWGRAKTLVQKNPKPLDDSSVKQEESKEQEISGEKTDE